MATLAALFVAAGACGGSDSGDSGKVRVVTTLPLFADFVREVGGDRVEVTSLVPPGTDPHTFEPSPSDVKKVAEADIAFANGMGLEPSAIKLIDANLKDGAPFVKLAHEIKNAGGQPISRDDPRPVITDNPHLWLNVGIASGYALLIREALASLDGAGRETYNENFGRYLQALVGLDTWVVREAVDSVPLARRKLVTTHDAFAYFGAAYGLEVVGVVSKSPGQEPSPGDVANISRTIKEQGVAAVFREPQLDSEGRVLEQAANDAGVQVCTLYSDSLDDKVKSYIELMRFDANEIARCLGGQSGG